MSGHTPGPWRVDKGFPCVIDSDAGMIGRCDVRSFGRDRAEQSEENKANSRLIAAAPDLLEALKLAQGFVAAWAGYYAVAYMEQKPGDPIMPGHQEALDKIAAAIAKAEGK